MTACGVSWCTALALDPMLGYCAVHAAQWEALALLRDDDGNLDIELLLSRMRRQERSAFTSAQQMRLFADLSGGQQKRVGPSRRAEAT